VIERRAAWGRGWSTSISPSMIAFDCRSLLRRKTANRQTRSTSEVTFALPNLLRN
jgi:hypothetical protein